MPSNLAVPKSNKVKLVIAQFSNGMYVNKEYVYDYSIYVGNKVVSSPSFVENTTDKDTVKVAKQVIVPTKYVLINEGNYAKEIDSEVYQQLPKGLQAFYKEEETRKELVELEDVERIVLDFSEHDYSKDAKPYESEIKKYLYYHDSLTKEVVELRDYFPLLLPKEHVLNVLASIADYQEKNFGKDIQNFGYYQNYSSMKQLTINKYAVKYTGQTKRVEIKKNNGMPYAQRRYRSVPDYGDVNKVVLEEDKNKYLFNDIYANNYKELKEKLDVIANVLLLNYKETIGNL